jgi:outer membrane protein
MKNSILVIFMMSTVTYSASAQKFAYMNSRAVLAALPEVGKADTLMAIYQKQLTSEGDSLGKVFDKEYKVFLDAKKAGTLSAIEEGKRVEQLKKQQAVLQNYSQDAQQKMATLRKQLLQPILGRLDKVIQDYAKAQKYDMIFDMGSGEALYVDPNSDVSEAVKKLMLASK